MFTVDQFGSTADFTDVPPIQLLEPGGIAFANGNGFGTSLYVRDAEFGGSSIFTADITGNLSVFLAAGASGYRPVDIAFAPGGDFGTDLYFSDSACDCIRSVNPSGSVSAPLVSIPTRPWAIAFGRGGVFGQDLYTFDLARQIVRVRAGGATEVIASGFDSFRGNGPIAFTQDGDALIVADSGAGKIYRITDAVTKPTADAGANQAIHAGQLVNLDGSGSFDDVTLPANLLYSWTFVSRPAGSTATLINPTTAAASFQADAVGTFVVQLVVEDEAGNVSDPDTVEVSSENTAPEADAGPDQVIVLSQAAILDGSGSSDPDMDPLNFGWSLISAPAGSNPDLTSPTTVAPTFTTDLIGLYEIELVVGDGYVDSAPDTVFVTVISGEDFAESQLLAAHDIVEALDAGSLDAPGHRRVLTNHIAQAIEAIQSGDLDEALHKIEMMIERTDGCALRGQPDGSGRGRDWVVDCPAQAELYPLLESARAALAP